MKIERRKIDSLSYEIIISIEKKDYNHTVNVALKNVSKNHTISGFRKGFVPMRILRKMFGQDVINYEVNKILEKSINDYIKKEKLDILTPPILTSNKPIDWNSQQLNFNFEVGIAPDFKINMRPKKFIKYNILPQQKELDDRISEIQKYFGDFTEQKTVSKDSKLSALFSEINNIDGQEKDKPNGINKSIFIDMELTTQKFKDKIINSSIDDLFVLETQNIFQSLEKLNNALNIKNKSNYQISTLCKLQIKRIFQITPSQVNKDLFDKVFGPDKVKNIEEFKSKIQESIKKEYDKHSDDKFFNDITDYIIENTSFNLPVNFLKKWISLNKKKEIEENNYEKFEKEIKQQLILKKIISQENIDISYQAIEEYITKLIQAQFPYNNDMNQIKEQVKKIINNAEEVNKITNKLATEKLLKIYLDKSKYKQKDINIDDFIKILNSK